MINGPIVEQSSEFLRSRRTQLVGEMPALEALLRGSLIERYKPCGKPGCKCSQGPGHGPKLYLSVSRTGGPPEVDYVPQSYAAQARQWLGNYRRVRALLEEICRINRELLRRRESL
jgi:hypothetical protein